MTASRCRLPLFLLIKGMHPVFTYDCVLYQQEIDTYFSTMHFAVGTLRELDIGIDHDA